jgi:hypothetical protein
MGLLEMGLVLYREVRYSLWQKVERVFYNCCEFYNGESADLIFSQLRMIDFRGKGRDSV